MTIAQNLPLTVANATPAALRAVAPGGLTALSVATCLEGVPLALYSFDPASLAADTGATPGIRKPDATAVGNPGRWVVRDWPDTQAAEGVHGELLVPVDIAAAGPSLLLVANGWTIVAVTENGAARRAWVRRIVNVANQ